MNHQKGSVILILAVVVLLTGIVLFAPFPFYHPPVTCKPGQTNCPQGWILGPSLISKFFSLWGNQSVAIERGETNESSTPSSDPTTNWETFTDSYYHLSIKYPTDWKRTDISQEDPADTNKTTSFKSSIAKLILTTHPLMNECMQIAKSENINLDGFDFVKKYYQGTSKGEMCKGRSYSNKLQLWITPLRANFGYNFQFEYTSPDKVEAEKLIDQILSTFKFIDNKETIYTCPESGWVDCMPILTEEAKKKCSPEAMEWYKNNCQNFQGGAM